MIANKVSCEVTITRTISSTLIHSVLIILEYFFSVFPYIISLKEKLYSGYGFHQQSQIESTFRLFTKMKNSNMDKDETVHNLFTNLYFLFIFGIVILGLTFYYLFIQFYKEKYNNKFLEYFFANFYNIFFFRYFSFIFIDMLIYPFIYSYLHDQNFISKLATYLLLLLFLFYCINAYLYINNNSIFLHVTNKQISLKDIRYPFDSFSMRYEKYLLLMKIISAVESNFLYINNFQSSVFVSFSSLLLFFLSVLVFVKDNFERLFIGYYSVDALTNFELNYLRKTIVVFNFLMFLFSFFIHRDRGLFLEILCFILCCILSIGFTTSKWLLMVRRNIINNQKELSNDIFCYLFTKSFSLSNAYQNEGNLSESFKSKFYNEIFWSIKFYYEKQQNFFSKNQETKGDSDGVFKDIYRIYQGKRKLERTKEEAVDILMNYLYSKLKKNPYKTYKYYHKILVSQRGLFKSVVRNLLIGIELNERGDKNSENFVFFSSLLALNRLNCKLNAQLSCFKEIINNSIQLQNAEKYLNYAKNLKKIREELFAIASQNINITFIGKENEKKKTEEDSESTANQRGALTSLRYELLIIRYVVENLSNQHFEKLGKLNIEIYEEFLSYSYFHSSYLISKILLNFAESTPVFQVVSISGEKKKKFKTVAEYYPQKYRNEGNDRLFQKIKKFKMNEMLDFEYVIDTGGPIEHFYYKFEVCESLDNSELILFGNFMSLYKRTILLEVTDKKEINVIGFSQDMYDILFMKPKLFNKLKKLQNGSCSLSFLFSDVVVEDKDKAKPYEANKYHIENYSTIECKLKYLALSENVSKVLAHVNKGEEEQQQQEQEGINKSKFIIQIQSIKDGYNKYKSVVKNLRLEKVLEVNDSTFLYEITISDTKLKKSTANRFLFHGTTRMDTARQMTATNIEGQDCYLNGLNQIRQSASVATTTKENNSVASVTAQKQEDYIKKNLIFKETKVLTLTSKINLVLDAVVILLCVIFFYIQVSQTNTLIGISSLGFDLRVLRISFCSVFYSVISLTCVKETSDGPIESKCTNKFYRFFDDLQSELNFTDYRINDFFLYEMETKLDSLKDYYRAFKGNIFEPKFSKYASIFSSQIRMNLLEQAENELISFEKNYTMDEALQQIINDEYILLNLEAKDDFTDTTFPIIPVKDGGEDYDFSFSGSQKFNQYQRSLFRILANYIYFGISFNNGETVFNDSYNSLSKSNKIIIIVFILLFISLNIVLFFICYISIRTGATLYQKLITNFSIKLEDPLYKVNLNRKVDNLLTLSQLYSKNPSELITKTDEILGKFQAKLKKRFLQMEQKASYNIKSKEVLEKEKREQEIKAYLDNVSYPMKYFYSKRIKPLLIKMSFILSIYLVIIIFLDVYLLKQTERVSSYRDYINANYDLQLYCYIDLGLLNLIHIFSFREIDLSGILNRSDTGDGVINNYFRTLFVSYKNVLEMANVNNYPEQSNFYPLNCDEMFGKMKDNIIEGFHKKLGLTGEGQIYNLQKILCKKYNFGLHPYYLYETFFTQLQVVHNRHSVKTYEGIYNIFNDEEFYILYLYVFFYIRPSKKNYDLIILTPGINDIFSDYITYVWLYLIINILLEGLIFALSKFLIFNKLHILKEFFFQFSRCLD